MRHLVTVILVMLVLGAVVSGCEGARRYDSRLTAADSLMRVNPDSALAMVESVSRDSLADEGDRAYRDLLLTQARYKAYVTATSDSDINRALAWYRAHSSEREKLTRAYIYKGAVMEELGHPDSAMLYYKTAEATAAPDDYFNLGYTNLKIGELYKKEYCNDSAVVTRMSRATRYFEAIGDTNYLIVAIGTQGLYDRIVGKDSALYFLEKAISLAKDSKSPRRFFYESKLAGFYFYGQDYRHAKDLALDIIADVKDDCEERTFYYYAARSYIKLNLIDSALWIKSMIPHPREAEDSLNYHLLLGELALAMNDYLGYASHSHEAHMIDERIMTSSVESTLLNTELDFDAQLRETNLKEAHQFNTILLTLAFLLLVVILISCGTWLIRRMNLRYKQQLDEVQKELENLVGDSEQKIQALETEWIEHRRIVDEKDQQLAEANKRIQAFQKEKENISSHISRIVKSRQAALDELYQNIRIKTAAQDGKRNHLSLISGFKKLFANGVTLRTPRKQSFWDNLKVFVDGEYRGIATFVEKNYPEMNEKEMHLFLLVCADLPNSIIRLCMGYSSDVTVSKNKKRLMKEKIGLEVRIEEFIQLYFQGKLDYSDN